MVPSWYGSLIGNQLDPSGYVYLRNRYYDPASGRFTQEDPIGLAGGMNLYGFAGGDPVNFTDPFGLKACPPDCDGTSGPTLGNGCPAIADHCAVDMSRAGAMAGGAAVGAVAGVGVMALGAEAAASSGVATFFRGVSSSEAAQIGVDKALKAIGGIEGAKYLTNTAKAAAEWGGRMHGEGSQVVQTTVNRAAAKGFEYLGRIDGIGEAWVAKMSALKDAAVKLLP